MTALSVFVYGTLRPGQVNYPIVQSAVAGHVEARLDGHSLRAAAHAHFPYAIDDLGHHVVGVLLRLKSGSESATLARLDVLEGYRTTSPETSHYRRVTCPVITAAGSSYGPAETAVEAWVYLAGSLIPVIELPLVDNGDWTTRRLPQQGWV
ncbi:MAG: gamma-glutamylcyclotransferase [Microlunatus sp.]|nr:gamma-glutamylcyclotransferase [Microlunatus sp.]